MHKAVMMMMMKLPILPCAEKLELVLSAAPKTGDNTDKDSKNRKAVRLAAEVSPRFYGRRSMREKIYQKGKFRVLSAC